MTTIHITDQTQFAVRITPRALVVSIDEDELVIDWAQAMGRFKALLAGGCHSHDDDVIAAAERRRRGL